MLTLVRISLFKTLNLFFHFSLARYYGFFLILVLQWALNFGMPHAKGIALFNWPYMIDIHQLGVYFKIKLKCTYLLFCNKILSHAHHKKIVKLWSLPNIEIYILNIKTHTSQYFFTYICSKVWSRRRERRLILCLSIY